MKTRDFVVKYRLHLGVNFSHSKFVKDFEQVFETQLEYFNVAGEEPFNRGQKFTKAVDVMKMKYNAICNKTAGVMLDSLWKFFYATVVIRKKRELMPWMFEAQKAEA